MVLISFQTFHINLHVTSQSMTLLSCAYVFLRLISVSQIIFSALLVFALERQSLKYSVNMLLTFTLYYDTRPGCLIIDRLELFASTENVAS